jgi:hypothetical protein
MNWRRRGERREFSSDWRPRRRRPGTAIRLKWFSWRLAPSILLRPGRLGGGRIAASWLAAGRGPAASSVLCWGRECILARRSDPGAAPPAAEAALLESFQGLDSSVHILKFFAQLSENFREVHMGFNLRIERNAARNRKGMNLRTLLTSVMGLLGAARLKGANQDGGLSMSGGAITTVGSPSISNESIDSRTRSRRLSVCETVLLSRSID